MTRRAATAARPSSRAEAFCRLHPREQTKYLESLTDDEALNLLYDWTFWRRTLQTTPAGDDWLTWLLQGGRGSGKTRPGAEECNERARLGQWGRIALVGATAADVRDVMIEGESGIKACAHPDFYPHYEPSKRRVTWPNGAMGFAYSAEEPDRLRGPQHHGAWCDEIAAWKKGPLAWDTLLGSLRLGRNPQIVATTTPRPLAWLRALVAEATTVVTRMSTRENAANLAPPFLSRIVARYQGSRLWLQEIEGVLMEDVEGALWTAVAIELDRVQPTDVDGIPTYVPAVHDKRVVGVDPPGGTITECGIVVVGRHAINDDPLRRHADVLDDRSEAGPPEQWAKTVVSAYHEHDCDAVIAETNYGGEMVRAVVHNVDPSVKVEMVQATRGKAVRAEPVAVLYDQHRMHHVGQLPELESEMTTWVPPGTTNLLGEDIGSTDSPNRLDALVWAVTYLLPPLGVVQGHVSSLADRQGAGWQPGQTPPRRT